jgi:hypothetical protein
MSPHFWVGERECAGKTSIYRGPLLLVLETPKPTITYSPAWQRYGDIMATKTLPSAVEATFDGSSVVWTGKRYDDAGQAHVTIDGKAVAIVDQYGPQRDVPFRWEEHGLLPGRHTIRVTLMDAKNPASKDHWINVSTLGAPQSPQNVLDAADLRGRLLPISRIAPPQVLLEVTAADGSKLRLRDYGTAGQDGTPYLSWLDVSNVTPASFSQTNPLRSTRPLWQQTNVPVVSKARESQF